MLFEKILQLDQTKCIALSEAFRKSSLSAAHMETYLTKFQGMLELMKTHSTTPLSHQPLFVWHDRNSASWMFEKHRAMYTLHGMLLADAKKCFDAGDHKGAKAILTKALDLSKQILELDYVKTPCVASMPEVQLEHSLANVFRTKAAYCFNLHMFKTTPTVALMAYKFAEIGNRLWKRDANIEFENKLKAHWHHAVASTSENFKETISHSTAAMELIEDPKFMEDHEEWVRRNETVHFETVEPIECKLYTLEEAIAKM